MESPAGIILYLRGGSAGWLASQLECWNATQSVSGHYILDLPGPNLRFPIPGRYTITNTTECQEPTQGGVQTGKPWQTKTGKITKKKAG